jgi:GMP synthase (glutamine-hydrolysing)
VKRERGKVMSNLKGTIEEFIEQSCEYIRARSAGRPVLCALSGGVDSAVCALLAHRAVAERLTCVFVDTGLMRKNEADKVTELFGGAYAIKLVRADAEKRFLAGLSGVTEPDQKRKIIGEQPIRVFEEEAKKLGEMGCFVQGTIYTDIMESGKDGHKQIKAHHNVGGLPEVIGFEEIIEPIKMLYKEEARECGKKLGLPDAFANRQPFPGPGLAIRCLGGITKERLDMLREADAIFCEEIEAAGLQKQVQQYFAVLTGVKSVGVRNGERCYEETAALRAVSTKDLVTAGFARLPYEVVEKAAARITGEVSGINRVVLDVTPKPPATIEWE